MCVCVCVCKRAMGCANLDNRHARFTRAKVSSGGALRKRRVSRSCPSPLPIARVHFHAGLSFTVSLQHPHYQHPQPHTKATRENVYRYHVPLIDCWRSDRPRARSVKIRRRCFKVKYASLAIPVLSLSLSLSLPLSQNNRILP